MARNGAGVYSLPATSASPAVADTLIESSAFNTVMTDVATALTQSIATDGQSTVSANIPFGGFKATGLAAGTARTDAATLANVQDATGVYVATVGGTADAITLTASPAITAYAAGQRFVFIASGANTGAATVNVNSVGSRDITKNGTTALAAGDIASGAIVSIIYDGTRFQLQAAIPMTAAAILAALLTVDGAGSTLDADTLDGVQGAAYAALADNETVSGTWDFTGDPTIDSIQIGFKSIPQNIQNGNYTAVLGDSGYHIYKASGGAGETITIPANSSVAYPIGTVLTIVNQGGGDLSIAITTDTMTQVGTGSTGTRTLANNGLATVLKVTSTAWVISGTGLS